MASTGSDVHETKTKPAPTINRLTTDPVWEAVDEYALSHLHPSSRPNHAALNSATTYADANGLPSIAAPTNQAKFFALQCRMLSARHALEFGTLGGYTAIWLASMNPKLYVTTLEYNATHASIAQHNLQTAGVAERVNCVVGPALEAMPKLQQDIESGKKERIDFAFIDADKANNWNYFDWAVKLGRSGTCIVVDNVVLSGHLINEASREHNMVQGARNVIEKVGADDRVEATLMQCVGEKGWDGFVIAVVK